MLMLKLASMVKEDLGLVYARANVFLAKGCLDLAENLYFKLLDLQEYGSYLDVDTHADILHNLGMLEEKRHNNDLAINYYQQAVDLNRQHSMTWLFLAKLYLNRFDCSGNNLDLKEGFYAIRQAEANNLHYPVIKFLKEKYMAI
jgi:tetratricopeptide (TPR) repeat protein